MSIHPVTMVHPATARVVDPELPVVSALLSEPIPGPIAAVAAAAEGEIVDSSPIQVTWWPGSSITVRYRTTVEGGEMAGTQDFVAVAGRIPDGAAIVEYDEGEVGVWRVPFDPALPGLSPSLDPAQAREILKSLGAEDGPVHTRMRAYRPGRRAVVSVDGPSHGIYLKVVRPKKVRKLHEDHKTLPAGLPVPQTLGFSADLGIVALQAMPGRTLREALEDPDAALPDAAAITELIVSLPTPPSGHVGKSMVERAPELASLLVHLVPDNVGEIDRFLAELGEETDSDLIPVHGDFYESQVMVENGSIVGLLDVDTYGLGRRGEDPGVMLGHLALWMGMSAQPLRVQAFAKSLIDAWDRVYDPVDIRRRAAATLFSLATGPFRVQTADWPGETNRRIALALQWLESARRVA